ncbi:BZ3501_MvSof-1269-A2-R1_Chr12-1g03362 [Microbotryum saponariae]|nr:BZ3501_MvSof-1269-A2-R1_Chr12-1g03362 [Microbotryum saponariae]
MPSFARNVDSQGSQARSPLARLGLHFVNLHRKENDLGSDAIRLTLTERRQVLARPRQSRFQTQVTLAEDNVGEAVARKLRERRLLDFRTVLVTFVGRPNDEIVSIRCTVVKSETNALMRQTPKSNNVGMSRVMASRVMRSTSSNSGSSDLAEGTFVVSIAVAEAGMGVAEVAMVAMAAKRRRGAETADLGARNVRAVAAGVRAVETWRTIGWTPERSAWLRSMSLERDLKKT